MAKLFGVSKCVATDGSGQSCNVQDTVANLAALGPTMKWGTPVLALVCVAFILVSKYALAPRLPRRVAVLANTAPLVVIVVTGEPRGGTMDARVQPWQGVMCRISLRGGLQVTAASSCRFVTQAAPSYLAAAAAYAMPAQFKSAGIGLAGSMPSGVPGPVTPRFPASTLQADTLALFTQALTVTLIGAELCKSARELPRAALCQ